MCGPSRAVNSGCILATPMSSMRVVGAGDSCESSDPRGRRGCAAAFILLVETLLIGGGRSPVLGARGLSGGCKTLRVWQRPGAHFMGEDCAAGQS